MKILQLLNHFLPQQTAGTETYCFALSKALQELGNEVAVLIPNYRKSIFESYTYEGIQVHQYPEPAVVDRSLIMGFREPDGLVYFRQFLQEWQPDIVQVHELAGSTGIGLAHLRIIKELNIPLITTFHLAGNSCKTGTLLYKNKELCDGQIKINRCAACYVSNKTTNFSLPLMLGASALLYKLGIDSTSWQNKLGTALGTHYLIQQQQQRLKQIVDFSDYIVVLTKWYQNILLANDIPKQKLVYIPQGLAHTFEGNNVINVCNDGALKLVFVGRISAFKGLHTLINALLVLPKKAISLDIYGQDDGTDYGKKLQLKTANATNIHWKGLIKAKDVINQLKAYDALCLCSTFSEMSPLVIQEAKMAGIPVIATNVYGNAEQIQHEVNGWLFPMNDTKALQQLLEKFIQNPSLLRSKKGQSFQPLSFKEIAQQYMALYPNNKQL